MPGYTKDEFRRMLVKAENALRAVYNQEGPRQTLGKVLPPHKFAAMTRVQVDAAYDFHNRHLMHRIAKILAL